MIREQVRSAISGVPVAHRRSGRHRRRRSGCSSPASQRPPTPAGIVLAVAGVLAVARSSSCGLKIVNPNEARVLQLFGSYRGTMKDAGPALGAAAS